MKFLISGKKYLAFSLESQTQYQSRAALLRKKSFRVEVRNEKGLCGPHLRSAVSNTVATCHMWLLVIWFVAILEFLKFRITLFEKFLKVILSLI